MNKEADKEHRCYYSQGKEYKEGQIWELNKTHRSGEEMHIPQESALTGMDSVLGVNGL